MIKPQSIPQYFLLGEEPHAADERFVHVENIARRSAPRDWTIRPHMHRDLHQLFVILAGRGTMQVGAEAHPFQAPAMLLVPAGEVHGFDFSTGMIGYAITFVDRLLRDFGNRERLFTTLFASAAAVQLDGSDSSVETLEHQAARLEGELGRPNVLSTIAAEAHLTSLLVTAVRACNRAQAATSERSPRAALVARFRDLIELNFRAKWPLERYGDALGVTLPRLRAACAAIAGRSPVELLHDRLIVEAKRNVIYTDMRVAEIAYGLGFDDNAYFSRFFAKRVGLSPAGYRQQHS